MHLRPLLPRVRRECHRSYGQSQETWGSCTRNSIARVRMLMDARLWAYARVAPAGVIVTYYVVASSSESMRVLHQ